MRRLAALPVAVLSIATVAALSACGGDRSPEAGAEEPVVRVGETVEGALAPGDSVFTADGSFYDLYAVEGEPLEPLEITLASADFDAFLAGGPSREDALRGVDGDDDGAGGTDARLLVRADTRGRYVVRANSLRGGESGAYTLTVQRARGREAGASMDATVGGTLRVGRPLRGRLEPGDEALSDGSLADTYFIDTAPGERFVATLASGDYDAYVEAGRVEDGEYEPVAGGEAAGLSGEARLSFTSRGGRYALLAGASRAGDTGAYTLRVDRADAMRDVDRRRFPGQWVTAGYGPSRRFAPVREVVQRERWLEETVAGLNEAFPLPADVRVRFEECGEPNALYDPAEQTVTYCYELVALFDQALRQEVAADRLASANRGAYAFVMLHEAGHALVDQLDLPITGREEDVVDQFASLHLIRQGFEGAWAAVDGVASLQGGTMFTESDFAGEHSLGPQRLFNVVCLVYGSDPSAYAALVPEALPEARAVRCPAEFSQVDKSFERLLELAYAG